MIEKLQPILSGEKERNARYVISDNFLGAWLAVIARNVRFARIQPVATAVTRADISLATHEGFAFDKLVRQILQECSRKGVGDFSLTEMVSGYWNKADGGDIEIDVVAIDEDGKRLRLGSCKRSESGHDAAALADFDGHVSRFLVTKTGLRFGGWAIEKALYSPAFSQPAKAWLRQKGYVCTDMDDLENWLIPAKAGMRVP